LRFLQEPTRCPATKFNIARNKTDEHKAKSGAQVAKRERLDTDFGKGRT
jgi:hypothetical protein